MRLLPVILTVAAAVLAAPPRATSANIVVNGGFESGDFSGWTLSGNTDFMGVDRFLPHTGLYAASVAPVGSLGYLGQTLPTMAGTTYTLSFWLANDDGTPNEFQALWNDVPVIRLVDAGPFDYRNFVVPVTATGPTSEVKFGFRQDPRSFYFDDVSVTAIPEPGTWACVVTGLALLSWRSARSVLRSDRTRDYRSGWPLQ